MLTGKVLGSVWATRKDHRLNGLKFLIIQPISLSEDANAPQRIIVAADTIGAGVGERVLVVTGSSARVAAGDADMPVDATVVGIIDD